MASRLYLYMAMSLLAVFGKRQCLPYLTPIVRLPSKLRGFGETEALRVGADVCPPLPMIRQTRRVLEQYQANGGRYQEVIIPDCGHSPHIEKPEAFEEVLLKHLQ